MVCRIVQLIMIIILLCCILSGCASIDNVYHSNDSGTIARDIENSDDVLGLSDIIFNPYMREPDSYYSESKLSMQENGVDYTNYWIQTVLAITKMHLEDDYEFAEQVIANEMATFKREGYFPRPEYQQFEYGWVSSMDAPTIAVASQMLYEHTGEEKYKIFVDLLSEYMLKDVSEHGYVGRVGDGRWLFEYAQINTTEDTAEFVLNGSLLGALGTAIIAKSTDNHELQALMDDLVENYKANISKYYYKNNAWCYYMLNVKRVQQPHYAIYEIRILDALYEVTQDEFFKDQADLRRGMLLSYYQCYLKDNQLYFLRAGAPHYYYIDIFDTELTFTDNDGMAISSVVFRGEQKENSIQESDVPSETKSIKWVAHTDFYDVDIGTISVIKNSVDTEEKKIECSFKASEDGVINNSLVHIVDDTGKANLMCYLAQCGKIDASDIIILELENLSEEEYSMGVDIYDSQGNALSRYLPNLHSGKCSIPISLLGFVEKNIEMTDLDEIKLIIYTNNKSEADIEIGKVYKFDNSSEYIEYLQQSEYAPIWQ